MGSHVLVVEDDDVIRALMGELLRGEGCTVSVARDGGEALALLRTSHRGEVSEASKGTAHPDVVLLDWRLPDLDGGAFLRTYRARPGPHAPIVVITASPGIAARALAESGAAAVVEKPIAFDALLDALRPFVACLQRN